MSIIASHPRDVNEGGGGFEGVTWMLRLVRRRFGKEIGVLTGIVGAAGGGGGFFLPTLLGALKGTTESYHGGFFIFALVSLGCAGCMVYVGRVWEGVAVRIRLAESKAPG
jgi:nitrate/nitrite transporter NarK